MHKNYIHKLGLGTVQFGLDYGISNSVGKTLPSEVKEILDFAYEGGVRTLDTAHLYGTSEEVLGSSMGVHQDFEVITKTIPIKRKDISDHDIDTVKKGIDLSINRLQQESLYGLLLHNADDFKSQNADRLYNLLSEYKCHNKISKIGVSVYDHEQIDFVLDHFDIDLIQIPMSVFDQRLMNSGALSKLKAHGVEIHVRSAFLQGIIFMNPDDLAEGFQEISPYVKEFHKLVKRFDSKASSMALAFLMQQEEVDKVICGVNSLAQFRELTEDVSRLPVVDLDIFKSLAIHDISLINPANWKKG